MEAKRGGMGHAVTVVRIAKAGGMGTLREWARMATQCITWPSGRLVSPATILLNVSIDAAPVSRAALAQTALCDDAGKVDQISEAQARA